MFFLKPLVKMILILIWLALFVMWLPVHLAVSICGLLHGVGKILFGVFTVLAVFLGMWKNALIFASTIAGTFIIVFFGVLLEMILENARHSIGSAIVG